MRWSINTKVVEEKVSTQQRGKSTIQTTNKTLRTTRTQYITVGDIVGAAKSATGAVKNLVQRLPNYINQFRSNRDAKSQAQANTAQMILNVATPLATILQGAEVYKTVMKVIGILTPIMKLVARGTGVWCSPGNVADIAQIVMGTVQQILIALITQAIIRLKEWIWNFEFQLREISSDASVIITKILRNNGNKLNKLIGDNILGNVNSWFLGASGTFDVSGSEAPKSILEERQAKLLSELDRLAGNSVDSKTIAGLFGVNKTNEDGEIIEFDKGWETEYELDWKHVRELRGSLNDGGIQYSVLDEDGNVQWKQSDKTDGSFCCFCKLELPNGNIIYLAGSAPYISKKAIIKTRSDSWSKDAYNQYNQDYYTYENKKKLKVKKLSKFDKDRETLLNYKGSKPLGLFDKDEDTYKPAQGVWYSEDNGEHWLQSGITDEYIGYMYEYKEKIGYPETVVVSSYDYHGLRYTTDGRAWEVSKLGEDDLDHGRFVLLTANENSKVRVYSELTATATISSHACRLIQTGGKNIRTCVKVKSDVKVKQNDSAYILWKKITDRIHYHYSNILNTFTAESWLDLRNRVFSGTYTWEDAERDYPV
jgi:DNA-binding ferritin-like protein